MVTRKTLPWKIAPKAAPMIEVGNPEYGVLELPKKESLTINEAQFIRDNTKDLPDIQQQAIQLAADIAKQESIPFVDAFEALTSGTASFEVVLTASAKKGDTEIKIAPLPRKIAKGAVLSLEDGDVAISEPENKGVEVLKIESLPVALKSGDSITLISPSAIAQENTLLLIKFQKESAEVAPLRNAVLATAMLQRIMGKEWTIEQTSDELPPQLIQDLAEFCGKEMNGWETEEETESEPVTEEVLKND